MIFNIFTGGGNGGWGYANLNFSIYRYGLEDTLPDTAEENAIAVITDNEITSYIFDSVEPSDPQDGMIWFVTSNSKSIVPINILKENGIKIYPVRAKQYVESEQAWKAVDVSIYQDGWTGWFNGILFDKGDKCEDITGGWVTKDGNTIEIINETTMSQIQYYTSSYTEGMCTANKIAINGFSTLCVNVVDIAKQGFIGLSDILTNHPDNTMPEVWMNSTGVAKLDISNVADGEYHIVISAGVTVDSSPVRITIDKVWLE